jgi:hypothetical protein
LHPGRRNGIL